MARIQLENVKKKFGKVTALDGVTIDVKDNEFFVLFGPAGAGKTTMLNCIAGITLPEEGLIKFDGEIMNLVDPAHRNVAMTFENYALYPQMTVYDNMAAALRSNLYKTDEATIKEKVYKAAKIMKMENLLERLPSQLSNGQKQRVAMGRSLVRNPNVFLMDEPLAHLDAKLRNSMRTELKKIQADLGSTCIYVTHDFLEAMALGDRIAIVKEGRIVQVGSGDEIYYLPCNKFVAQLMGEPQINIIAGKMVMNGGQRQFVINVLGQEVALPMPEDAPLFAKLDQLGTIKYNGKLVVALEGAWQPWSYHDESDTLVGYDVEVSRAIAEKLGVEPEYVESDWDSLFAGLDAGRFDMVCNGVEVTDERALTYDFTTPYGYIHTALAVRKDNDEIKTFEDLKGKTTANSLASTYMELAESYGATVQGIDTLEETIQLLAAGRIDATLNADVSFYDYLNVHPDADFKIVAQTEDASHVAIPLRKGDNSATLLEAVNNAIDELRADGTLKELSEKYFGQDISSEN